MEAFNIFTGFSGGYYRMPMDGLFEGICNLILNVRGTGFRFNDSDDFKCIPLMHQVWIIQNASGDFVNHLRILSWEYTEKAM